MSTPPFRILLLISNLEIGGAQEIVRTLAEHFNRAGHPTVVGALSDGPLRPEIERLGIPVEILPERRYSVLLFPLFLADMWRIRQAILRVVDQYQINIIQTQLLRSLDFLALSLRLSRPLLVFWTFHNARFVLREEHLPRFRWLLGIKRNAHAWLYRLCARWVNGLIAVSEDVKKAIHEYAGRLHGKVTVILNSVDVARYQQPVDRHQVRQRLGIADHSTVIAVVAMFKEQKGHRYLIEATPTLRERFPDLQILFIGDGELRQSLQRQVEERGLRECIHFLGLRSDVSDLLAASDCFVLPSLWEGLPMALVEAMARGLPVVATHVSGTKEVMIDGQTGLLVPPGDVDRLIEAVTRLLSDAKRAREMGAAGRQRVASLFSIERQVQEHLALYQQQWKITFSGTREYGH
jgi:glycosyltransferase involved in cell wall biosynthesis